VALMATAVVLRPFACPSCGRLAGFTDRASGYVRVYCKQCRQTVLIKITGEPVVRPSGRRIEDDVVYCE
jgi:hypothetical protein